MRETDETCFEWPTDRAPSTAVVTAVAAVEDAAPTDLPPLYESIDPQALDRLVASAAGAELRLAFEYAGYQVTVHADGIDLHPGDAPADGDRDGVGSTLDATGTRATDATDVGDGESSGSDASAED